MSLRYDMSDRMANTEECVHESLIEVDYLLKPGTIQCDTQVVKLERTLRDIQEQVDLYMTLARQTVMFSAEFTGANGGQVDSKRLLDAMTMVDRVAVALTALGMGTGVAKELEDTPRLNVATPATDDDDDD